jgi:hypothetical protein
MKKTKIIGALLAGVMAFAGAPLIPGLETPFSIESDAASKLAAPQNVKASVSGTTVKLSWSAVKGADAYRVYQFNSDSGEYETLKNVSGTSTSVKGLAKGTYNFRVAALVKSGDKLKAQTKSSAVKATVKGTSTSSNTSGASGIFNLPAFGTTGKKAISAIGLKNYQYADQEQNGLKVGCYVGTAKINGKDCTVALFVDKNDIYYMGCVMADKSVTTFTKAFKKMKSSFGKPVMDMDMFGIEMYLWASGKTNTLYMLMGSDGDDQSLTMYYAISYKYAPEEITKGVDLNKIEDFDMSSLTSILGGLR